ncbi:MAG: hypothetical protein U0556_09710 [Dehalococcoidia bacterium]
MLERLIAPVDPAASAHVAARFGVAAGILLAFRDPEAGDAALGEVAEHLGEAGEAMLVMLALDIARDVRVASPGGGRCMR